MAKLLVALTFLLAGCATNLPTAPQTASLDKWDGEPVVETDLGCAANTGPSGCAVRGAGQSAR